MTQPVVALIKGGSRYQNVFQSLNLLKEEISQEIRGKKKVLVKVNFVSFRNQLAATHIEAVKALLDFLKPLFKEKVEIIETGKKALEGFSNFNYLNLPEKYNVKLDSFVNGELEAVSLFDVNLRRRLKAQMYKEVLESDFLISLTPAKTHDYSIVTLGLKNVAVGFLKNPSLVHQGYQGFNKNIYLLIKKIKPHLSIIDGTVGMEGNGPIYGKPKPAGWVIASLDSIQADIVATKLMGFDPQKIGYLYYFLKEGLATDDLKKVLIRGGKFENCRTDFLPPDNLEKQQGWNLPPTLREKIKAFLAEKIYTPFKESRLGEKLNLSPIVKLINRLFGFQ